MACNKLWGLGIAMLNVMYSFVFLGISCSDLASAMDNDKMPLVWIVAYALNAGLNTFLFLRLLRGDNMAVLFWFVLTCVLLLMRCFCIRYKYLSEKFRIAMIIVNAYIVLSLIIMILVVVNIKESRYNREPVLNQPKHTARIVSSPTNRAGQATSSNQNHYESHNSNHTVICCFSGGDHPENEACSDGGGGANNGSCCDGGGEDDNGDCCNGGGGDNSCECCDGECDTGGDDQGCDCDCDTGGDAGGCDTGGDDGGCDTGGDDGGDCGGGGDD